MALSVRGGERGGGGGGGECELWIAWFAHERCAHRFFVLFVCFVWKSLECLSSQCTNVDEPLP